MELIFAVLGPVLGGIISLGVFVTKKNSDMMSNGFDRLHNSVDTIDRKIDDLRVDVAKNYVTNDQLTTHIQSEEGWHLRFGESLSEMRNEVTGTKVIVDRMWLDFQNRGKL